MVSDSVLSFVLGDTEKGVNMLIASGAIPPVVKIHNNVSHAVRLHKHLGNGTKIVLRMIGAERIIDDGISTGKEPAEIGGAWFAAVEPAMVAAPWGYFEVGGPGFNSDDPVYADYYADIIEDAMRRMHQAGYKGVVLCFYEGNPHTLSDGSGVDGWAPYWDVIRLAAEYGFPLGPQAYWVDGRLDMNDLWHAFRLFTILADYWDMWPEGTQFIITEFGVDLRDGRGWISSGCGEINYWKALKEACRIFRAKVYPKGVKFLAFTIFALHENDLWPDFNYWVIFRQLLDYVKSLQGPPATPEPGPGPAPPAGTVAVKTTSKTGQNIRAHHSLIAPIVGGLDYGAVGYTSKDEVDNLGKAKTWCYVKTEDGEGWMGAWLLEAA